MISIENYSLGSLGFARDNKEKFMNRIAKIKNENGSALVAVLLVMLMVSVIVISIASRSVTSLNVSIGTKRSNDAYQDADEKAEKILTQIRAYGSDNRSIDAITITNLCSALGGTFCADNKVRFLNVKGDVISSSNYGLSIKYIKRFSLNSDTTNESTERAVSVPVTRRVMTPFVFKQPQECVAIDPGPEPNNDVFCSTAIMSACGATPCHKVSFNYDKDILGTAGVNYFSIGLNSAAIPVKRFQVDTTNTESVGDVNCELGSGVCYMYIRDNIFSSNGVASLFGRDIYLRAESNANYYIDSEDVGLTIPAQAELTPCISYSLGAWSPAICPNPTTGNGMQSLVVNYSPSGCKGGVFYQFTERPCP